MLEFYAFMRVKPRCPFSTQPLLLTDRALRRPFRVTDAFEVHLEKSYRFLARLYVVADFAQGAVFDCRDVSNRHRAGRNLPCVAVGGGSDREIARVAHRIGMQRVAAGRDIV